MRLTNLERKVLAEARRVFENPKLRSLDIRVVDDRDLTETAAEIPELGVWVCVFKTKDKRKRGG